LSCASGAYHPAVRISLLCLALLSGLLVACGAPLPVDSQQSIEAWSFNLRYGTARDGENSWPQRVDFVQDLLREARPDLLGVQEAMAFQLTAVGEALPGYEYWGRPRTANRDGEQCGIWYRLDRYRRVDSGHFWLSPTPEVVGSRGWDAALPRMASWVVLEDLQDGSELLVCNTHFDHRGAEARLESARLLARRLPELAAGRPIVLLGDFNASYESAPWQALAGEGAPLLDSYLAVSATAEDPLGSGTFHGFSGQPDGRRIDWVLVSPGVVVEEAEVLRPRRGERSPSDHEPVRAQLRLPIRAEG
jgi:endonuclease/exonuclease/phosphatase family metal-dependent hydrolase